LIEGLLEGTALSLSALFVAARVAFAIPVLSLSDHSIEVNTGTSDNGGIGHEGLANTVVLAVLGIGQLVESLTVSLLRVFEGTSVRKPLSTFREINIPFHQVKTKHTPDFIVAVDDVRNFRDGKSSR
jgi:hypothetical protein